MSRIILANAALALSVAVAVAGAQPQPKTSFKERIKLTDSDIQRIDQGQVVTKLIDSGDTKYDMATPSPATR